MPADCSSECVCVCVSLQAMEGPPRKVTFMPVVDEQQLVGLVTLHGLVSAGL